MGRFRNPRYAPELLERKLNPSPLLASPPPADYCLLSPASAAVPTSADPPLNPGFPPPPPPTPPPTGPAGPALTLSTDDTCTTWNSV